VLELGEAEEGLWNRGISHPVELKIGERLGLVKRGKSEKGQSAFVLVGEAPKPGCEYGVGTRGEHKKRGEFESGDQNRITTHGMRTKI